ncbi:transcription factor cwo-like isoform X2 [Mizuhopecten yessoensis]|nr:transcription factor cwo-like isoform X2 [Mizuhopecten yessoensis]
MLSVKKPKIPRDPMSHRIIEKRRRDRMNNCLSDLSQLIPSNYLKQGQGRIEKTEIIEMATRHITHLQNLNKLFGENEDRISNDKKLCCKGKFYLGFKDCQDEIMRFCVEQEGWDANDPLCCKIMSHLNQTSSKFISSASGKGSTSCSVDDVNITDECSNQSLSPPDTGPYLMAESSKYPETSDKIKSLIKHENSVEGSWSDYDQCDKSLRSLLKPTDCSSGTSGEACAAYMALKAYEDSTAYPNRQEDASYAGSDFSSVSKIRTGADSDQSGSNVYKFKHNITKRFSQDEKYHHPTVTSATSSRSWQSDDSSKPGRKVSRHGSRSPSSDDTNYPASSHSSYGADRICKKGLKKSETSNTPLPAFVLHPKGTHYIPLSIHPSHIQNIFPKESSRDSSGSNFPAYHPISIPVNFSGPCVSIKNLQPPCSADIAETIEKNADRNSYTVL